MKVVFFGEICARKAVALRQFDFCALRELDFFALRE